MLFPLCFGLTQSEFPVRLIGKIKKELVPSESLETKYLEEHLTSPSNQNQASNGT